MNIRYITVDDVAKIFKGNIESIINVIINSFVDNIHGNVIFPDKISQIFDATTQNRINCMPATILGDEMVCGMKWVSVFPTNNQKGVQNVTGLIVLSEIKTGQPIAIIDGTLSTCIRTAAIGCIAARYLAPSKVETIGIIGSGVEARMHFALLKHYYPTIKECRVSSRKLDSEYKFVECMSKVAPDVKFVLCKNDTHLCASNSDIIVTAISGQSPVLKASNITKGGLYIHVGGWEDEFGVALKADKIVCDDWNTVKHRSQTICRMYSEGLLGDDDIHANLQDLISGKKVGRENDNEFIYFNSVGLSYIDVSIANYIYKESLKMGYGQNLEMSNDYTIDYKDYIM